jgi:hypothetical protein
MHTRDKNRATTSPNNVHPCQPKKCANRLPSSRTAPGRLPKKVLMPFHPGEIRSITFSSRVGSSRADGRVGSSRADGPPLVIHNRSYFFCSRSLPEQRTWAAPTDRQETEARTSGPTRPRPSCGRLDGLTTARRIALRQRVVLGAHRRPASSASRIDYLGRSIRPPCLGERR